MVVIEVLYQYNLLGSLWSLLKCCIDGLAEYCGIFIALPLLWTNHLYYFIDGSVFPDLEDPWDVLGIGSYYISLGDWTYVEQFAAMQKQNVLMLELV